LFWHKKWRFFVILPSFFAVFFVFLGGRTDLIDGKSPFSAQKRRLTPEKPPIFTSNFAQFCFSCVEPAFGRRSQIK